MKKYAVKEMMTVQAEIIVINASVDIMLLDYTVTVRFFHA